MVVGDALERAVVRLGANPGVALGVAVKVLRCATAMFRVMYLLLQDDIRHLLVEQMIIRLEL